MTKILMAVGQSPVMMDSREIAELTGKDHGNVMRDIRAMVEAISMNSNLNPYAESTTYVGKDGRQYPQYELDKDTCLTLLLGYDAVARMKVVKRWQELEAGQTPQLPRSLAEALRLAADQAEQIEQQQAALVLAAPKVAFVDRYVAAASGEKGFREVCKLLKANESQFRDFLTREKIMYVLAGKLTPHAQHMDTGRFVVKTGTAQKTDHAYAQAKFTPKGVEWVAGQWGKHQAKLALASFSAAEVVQ